MVSINALLDWRPDQLGAVADTLVRRRKVLADLQDEIDAADPPPSWVSGAAHSARQAHERLRLRLLDMAAEVSDVVVNLDDAQTRITAAKRDLEDALSIARHRGFTVDHVTGVVRDPRVYEDLHERAVAAHAVDAVADSISAALTQAAEADLDLAASLEAAAAGKVDGGPGSIGEALAQLPTRMDQMTPEQLAALLGDKVAIHTISAYLEAEAELATWEIEGKAKADYMVMADGSVIMALHLEAGLGREIEVSGTEADVGAGGTTDLELAFDSVAEAQAFLDGLDDRAFDLGWRDAATVPLAVADNVAQYVQEQEIRSFRTGVYGYGEAELDQPWARGALSGRLEASYDWVQEKYAVKLEAAAEAELGGKGSGYDAAGALSGELRITKAGAFDELVLAGKLSATAANEKLGLSMPSGTSTGQGVDVQVVVAHDNPARGDVEAAFAAGEYERAKDLALENGQLLVRQTLIEQYSSGEREIDLEIAEVEWSYGASGETATRIWFREAGRSEIHEINPAELPVNRAK